MTMTMGSHSNMQKATVSRQVTLVTVLLLIDVRARA
jgi:hypothetical protein